MSGDLRLEPVIIGSGLAVVKGICRVTGKPYQTGPVDFQTVKDWITAGKPVPVNLPYPEETCRFITSAISPKGWRLINEPILT